MSFTWRNWSASRVHNLFPFQPQFNTISQRLIGWFHPWESAIKLLSPHCYGGSNCVWEADIQMNYISFGSRCMDKDIHPGYHYPRSCKLQQLDTYSRSLKIFHLHLLHEASSFLTCWWERPGFDLCEICSEVSVSTRLLMISNCQTCARGCLQRSVVRLWNEGALQNLCWSLCLWSGGFVLPMSNSEHSSYFLVNECAVLSMYKWA